MGEAVVLPLYTPGGLGDAEVMYQRRVLAELRAERSLLELERTAALAGREAAKRSSAAIDASLSFELKRVHAQRSEIALLEKQLNKEHITKAEQAAAALTKQEETDAEHAFAQIVHDVSIQKSALLRMQTETEEGHADLLSKRRATTEANELVEELRRQARIASEAEKEDEGEDVEEEDEDEEGEEEEEAEEEVVPSKRRASQVSSSRDQDVKAKRRRLS